jgi:hypothetical protein
VKGLLFEEPPLVVSPSLAKALGSVDEAIVLQQVHYWLQRSSHEHDGRKWVYNSAEEWQEQFSFWSVKTIRRIFGRLREKGLLLTGNYNQSLLDRTLWYSIDYELLDQMGLPFAQTGKSMSRKGTSHVPERDTSNHKNTTETTDSVVVVVEAARGEVFRLWKDNMPGSMTPIIADDLNDLIDTYGPEEVRTAIDIAVKAGNRNIRYVRGVLVKRAAGSDGRPGHGQGGKQTKVEASMAAVDEVFAAMERGEFKWE